VLIICLFRQLLGSSLLLKKGAYDFTDRNFASSHRVLEQERLQNRCLISETEGPEAESFFWKAVSLAIASTTVA
jgi:hypothetical protein